MSEQDLGMNEQDLGMSEQDLGMNAQEDALEDLPCFLCCEGGFLYKYWERKPESRGNGECPVCKGSKVLSWAPIDPQMDPEGRKQELHDFNAQAELLKDKWDTKTLGHLEVHIPYYGELREMVMALRKVHEILRRSQKLENGNYLEPSVTEALKVVRGTGVLQEMDLHVIGLERLEIFKVG